MKDKKRWEKKQWTWVTNIAFQSCRALKCGSFGFSIPTCRAYRKDKTKYVSLCRWIIQGLFFEIASVQELYENC